MGCCCRGRFRRILAYLLMEYGKGRSITRRNSTFEAASALTMISHLIRSRCENDVSGHRCVENKTQYSDQVSLRVVRTFMQSMLCRRRSRNARRGNEDAVGPAQASQHPAGTHWAPAISLSRAGITNVLRAMSDSSRSFLYQRSSSDLFSSSGLSAINASKPA